MATLKEAQAYLVNVARESSKKFQYITTVIHQGDSKDDYLPGHVNTNVLREAQKWFSIYLKGNPIFVLLGSNLRQADKFGNPQWDVVRMYPRNLEAKLKKELEKVRAKTMVKGWEREEGYEYSPDDPHNQAEWLPTQDMMEEVQRIEDFGHRAKASPSFSKESHDPLSPTSPTVSSPSHGASPYEASPSRGTSPGLFSNIIQRRPSMAVPRTVGRSLKFPAFSFRR
jgi:hypothetical protein